MILLYVFMYFPTIATEIPKNAQTMPCDRGI